MFPFPIDGLVVTNQPKTAIAFHPHGLQGRSLLAAHQNMFQSRGPISSPSPEPGVTQDLLDPSREFRLCSKNAAGSSLPVIECRSTDDVDASIDLYILAGHDSESTYRPPTS